MVALVKSMTGDHPAHPVLVFSNNPLAGGLDKARALGIETASIDHKAFGKDREAYDADLNRCLEKYRPDFLCFAGYMRISTPGFIEKWQGKILNIHPSLLPKYKGLHTHKRALEAGDATAGCSVHEVTAELDGGPILGQAELNILAGETVQSLADRILPLEHRLYPAVLRRFVSGDRTPIFL